MSEIAEGGWVSRLGELQLKSTRDGPHGKNFKRCGAGPGESLEGVVSPATRTPTTVGAAHIEGAIWGKLKCQGTALEAFTKTETGPLQDAIDFLNEAPHEDRVRLVADKHLITKRSEAAATLVTRNASRTVSHDPVWKHHHRRAELGNSPTLGSPA